MNLFKLLVAKGKDGYILRFRNKCGMTAMARLRLPTKSPKKTNKNRRFANLNELT